MSKVFINICKRQGKVMLLIFQSEGKVKARVKAK